MNQSTMTITIETSPSAAPLPSPSLLAGFARLASSLESSDFTDGVLAGLALAGRPDLRNTFLDAVIASAAAANGMTFAELVGNETATAVA